MGLYLISIVPFIVAIAAWLWDNYTDKKCRDTQEQDMEIVIHYVERVIDDKYITSCGHLIQVGGRNVTTTLSQTTCMKCLEKIT